jgi:hypothetical protein
MPNCFTLTPKGSIEPATLPSIDDAMCAHFGVTPDADRYYRGWVDQEGFALAMGRDWQYMRDSEYFADRLPIVEWLAANYTPDAFAYR